MCPTVIHLGIVGCDARCGAVGTGNGGVAPAGVMIVGGGQLLLLLAVDSSVVTASAMLAP